MSQNTEPQESVKDTLMNEFHNEVDFCWTGRQIRVLRLFCLEFCIMLSLLDSAQSLRASKGREDCAEAKATEMSSNSMVMSLPQVTISYYSVSVKIDSLFL